MKFSSHRFSIAANTYSNHAILAKLRKLLLPELEGWFVPMLTLTQGMKWERLGYIALDSSTIKPHASKHKALSSGHLEQIKVQLCEEAQTLLARAEVTDRTAWSDEIDLPEERVWREERLRVLVDAKAPLEAEVEARYEEEQRAYGTTFGSSKQAGGFSRNGSFHWLSEVGWIAYSRANLETIFNSFGVSSAILALSLALCCLRCLDIVIISATRGCSQLQPSLNHLSSFQDPRYFLINPYIPHEYKIAAPLFRYSSEYTGGS